MGAAVGCRHLQPRWCLAENLDVELPEDAQCRVDESRIAF